jgi:hypothetical protein
MQAQLSSEPADFLLKCFNALSPEVAAHPDKILEHLNDYRLAPLGTADIADSSKAGTFSKAYSNQQSTQSAYAQSAMSFGLSGSYGPYSGSCQANKENERESASDTINGTLTAIADYGTLVFKRSENPVTIAEHLDPVLLHALNAIDSAAAAEAFTRIYGTHLVLGVRLGGTLTLVVKVTSKSLSEKEKLSAEVDVAYNGIGSMEATASASKEVKAMSSTKSLEHKVQVIGGSPGLGASVDAEVPASIQAWVDSCGVGTVSGLFSAVELYTLAAGAAAAILKSYLDLCQLKHSIENPVVFSTTAPLQALRYNPVSIAADKDYKIISGGAWLDENSSDFLTASYPAFDNGVINAWQATSHDSEIPTAGGSDLVGYAIGVYDPADLLSVFCGAADGANPDSGADTAVKTLDAGYVLTGGGCQTSTDRKEPRYLTGSYPKSLGGSTYNSWVADGHDYGYESKATLKAWAIGIRLKDAAAKATIGHQVIKQVGGLQSHGNTLALLGAQASLAGGGVQLSENKENLIHASFPTMQGNKQMGWQEFNGDLNGVFDTVVATAYAITLQLTSTAPGVTLQPYHEQVAAAVSAAR